MAVVRGINQITGTIENVTYYTMHGSDKEFYAGRAVLLNTGSKQTVNTQHSGKITVSGRVVHS